MYLRLDNLYPILIVPKELRIHYVQLSYTFTNSIVPVHSESKHIQSQKTDLFVCSVPAPILPSVSLWPTVWLDAVLLSIIVYSITVSLGTIFAAKRGYTIDPNQV